MSCLTCVILWCVTPWWDQSCSVQPIKTTRLQGKRLCSVSLTSRLQSSTQWGFFFIMILIHFTRMTLVLIKSTLSLLDTHFSWVLKELRIITVSYYWSLISSIGSAGTLGAISRGWREHHSFIVTTSHPFSLSKTCQTTGKNSITRALHHIK